MKQITFEQALKELEDIVANLEKNDLSLDESMKLYSKGNELSAFCLKCLEEAKLKITDVSDLNVKQE